MCCDEEIEIKIAIPEPENRRVGSYENYFRALEQLGAKPVQVNADCDPSEFDGVLMPGGADIHPSCYGKEIDGSVNIDPELDTLQWAVLDSFVKAKKPVFGICRGHQMINAYFGGTLIQDLPNRVNHVSETPKDRDRIHESVAEKGSFIETLYGERFVTNSAHHQAVDCIGEGLKVVQRHGDVIEAMLHETLPVWTVQWHPERMCFGQWRGIAPEEVVDGSRVLGFFVDRCREHKEEA